MFKHIPGYGEKYLVSDKGVLLQMDNDSPLHMQGKSYKGYKHVYISYNGKSKSTSIHRIVAKTFLPNPYNLPQVNHKNGIHDDNRVDNLEWCTGEYNNEHAMQNGWIKRYKVLQISLSGKTLMEWSSGRHAAKILGLSSSCIIKCCQKTGLSHGGYQWVYADIELRQYHLTPIIDISK